MAPASSLRFPEVNIPIDDLERLQTVTSQILAQAGASLKNYYDDKSGGFFHVLPPDLPPDAENTPGDFSKASTATAVAFLVDSGRWTNPRKGEPRWHEKEDTLAQGIYSAEWSSARLPKNNPFTSSFLLELMARLIKSGARKPSYSHQFLRARLRELVDDLADDGAIHIGQHPPHAYLTHLAIRALSAWDDLDQGDRVESVKQRVWDRALADLSKELALLSAIPDRADRHQIGYACLLLAALDAKPTPNDLELINHGLKMYFEGQLPDGGWPLGRPLFHYPDFGNAYCFEFEFLVQLLSTSDLGDQSLLYLEHLDKAVQRLTRIAFDLPEQGNGWSSGHHQQLNYPESWSTASVLHFCFLLDRLLATASVVIANRYLGSPRMLYSEPDASEFDDLLDSRFPYEEEEHSLKQTFQDLLIEPVLSQDSDLMAGRPMTEFTPVAAIMFGPPGTSKTTYASSIAAALGWPLLTVDPSHLLRRGLNELLPELNRLFQILNNLERVLIFLDEVDELVQERVVAGDPAQRFITTTMLPKIAALRERRRTVLLVATNHIEVFDTAIRRPGRFDMIVPVLPPTLESKLSTWTNLGDLLQSKGLADVEEVKAQLADLTYIECRNLVRHLYPTMSAKRFRRALNFAHERCSYMEDVPLKDGPRSWKEVIQTELDRVRLPPPAGT